MELLQAEKPNMSLHDENEAEEVLNNMKKQEGKAYKKEEVDVYSKQKDDTMEVLSMEVCNKKEANEDTKPEADQFEVDYEDDFEDISEEISESIDEDSTTTETTSSTTSSSPSEATDDETEPSIVQIQKEISLAQVQQEPSLAKGSSATVGDKSESMLSLISSLMSSKSSS